jgi:hypothetical protein
VTRHEYNLLRDQIEHDYREKLRALELVWTISQTAAPHNGHSQPRTAEAPEAEDALETAARKAIAGLPYFSIAEIDREIRKASPQMPVRRASLQALIRRLVATGDVVFVEGRRGKPTAIYARSESEKIKLLKDGSPAILEAYPDLLSPPKTSG